MSTRREDKAGRNRGEQRVGAGAGAHADDALRQRFAVERDHDAATAPPMARVLSPRPSHRRQLLHPVYALGAAAILVVAVSTWRRGSIEPDAPAGIVLVPGEMRVPTDFLLDLASNAMTRSDEMPSIGAIDWYPLVSQPDLAPNTDRRRN